MELIFGSLLAIVGGLDWTTDFTIIESLFVIMIVVVCLVSPLVMTCHFKRKHK
jgi:hypothetical protein